MLGLSRERWEALRPLLDEALDLAPEARSAWLDSQRSSNPLLAAEVEALLAREAAIEREGFLDLAGGRGVPPASTLEGQRLGPWTLERQIGQGGMGSVWLARRNDGRFEGTAAIKFLSLAVAGATGEARFRREGSLLARLSHPNIATLLDAGVTPAAQPYLVLEHVNGTPLDAWCTAHQLDIEARVRLFQQVLDAVAHAHAHLIVHRDLKPANILVTPEGRVKLLDFGIAKLLEEGGDGMIATGTAERLLTLEYAAPEQLRGDPISTATDVYALGVVLYRLLTGRHPTSPAAQSPADQIRGILEADPARLPRPLAGDLDNILARALRKEPLERYPSVTALADDLARFLRHEPVSARPATWAYRAGKFVRRNRGAVAAGALVTLGLAGATLFSILQMREARVQRDVAVREARRADAQVEFQDLLMSEVGDQPITMRQVLDTARGLLEQQAGGDQRLRTALLLQLVGSYGELGETSVRDSLLARAESLARAGSDTVQLAAARCARVALLRKQGDYPAAWRMVSEAESLANASRDPRTRSECLRNKGVLASETHRNAEGLVALRHALAIRDSIGETGDKEYLDLLDDYSYALDGVGRTREAAAVERGMIATADSSGRGGTMDAALMWHNLAFTIVSLGEIAPAESLYHRALERMLRSGRLNWMVAIHYAEVALMQGHPDSAAKYFDLVAKEGVADKRLYIEGRGLFGLARAEAALGQVAAARRTRVRFAQVFASYPSLHDTDDQIPDPIVVDGWISLATGDTAAAKASFEAMLRKNGYAEGKEKKHLRPIVLLAARCALALGQNNEALDYARQARTIATVDSEALRESAFVGEAALIEGRALRAQGDSTGARAAVAEAVAALQHGAGSEAPDTRAARALADSLRLSKE